MTISYSEAWFSRCRLPITKVKENAIKELFQMLVCFYFDASSPANTNEVMANTINRTAPMSVTVLTEILDASIFPPMIAAPVHRQCAIEAPKVTIYTFYVP